MCLTLQRIVLSLPLLAVFAGGAGAQGAKIPATQQELVRTLTELDAAVFDAYNKCKVPEFASYFVDDVEFYHDQTGEMMGRQKLLDALEKNICGKVQRKLVAGSLQIYPMKGYGAVMLGVHRFYPANVEKPEATGEAKFIHLWHYKDGAWRITRVISYDHIGLK
jgi:hypothetical protein